MVIQGIVVRHRNASMTKSGGLIVGGYIPELAGYEGDWWLQSSDLSSVMVSDFLPR